MLDKVYDYAIIDAQYFHVRNFMMIKDKYSDLNEYQLARLTVQSIFKLRREVVNFNTLILCWDRRLEGEYHKAKYLANYKGDRPDYNVDLQRMKDSEAPNKEEIARLERELKLIQVREFSKFKVIDAMDSLGGINIIVKGYEADDIANVLTSLDPDKSKVMITVDSDWKYLVNRYTDYYHSKQNKLYKLDDVILELGHDNLYGYKLAVELFLGSHNNVTQFTDLLPRGHKYRVNKSQTISDLNNYGIDFVISEFPEELQDPVKNAWNAFDFRNKDEWLVNFCKSKVNSHKFDEKKYHDFLSSDKFKSLGIKLNHFDEFWNKNKGYELINTQIGVE